MGIDQDVVVDFIGAGVRFADGTDALSGVDLRIRPGEFVSIVGPSGCGKSTLLRVAAGLQALSSGQCNVDRSQVGYVFQDATLLPWLTVRKNVSLPLEIKAGGADDGLVEQALGLVGLSEFAEHRPAQLSGGMRMRVSLARAIVGEPAIFLFDEPFGALDEMSRESLNDEIRDMYVDRRFTALFVTHSIPEAVYMSSRVVVLSPRPGRIVADIDVVLPGVRTHDIRYTPEFGEISAQVSRALRGATA